MSARTSRVQKILPYLLLLGGILGLLAIPLNHAASRFQPFQFTTTSTICTVSAQSSLTVEVVDSKNIPLPNAIVLLNGTYVCNGQVYPSNFSGITDSRGSAAFSVVPYVKYNVTVIPPRSLTEASVVVSVVTAPPPTMFATTTVAIPEFAVASGSPWSISPALGAGILATISIVGIAAATLRGLRRRTGSRS